MTPSTATDFTEARRESTSFLTAAERRCLIWMAARLPGWMNSDHLTGLALLAMAVAGASFWAARLNRLWLVMVVASLDVNWFGDSLDGTLARVRRQQRPRYGFYVDHVVDCFGVLFLLGGLALSGFMHPLVATGLLVAYFMLSIEIYLATYCLTVFRLSFWGMGPTELRVVLAAGALALMRDPHVEVLGGRYELFDVGGVVAIAGILMVLLISVFRNTRALYRAEPLPTISRTASGRSTGRRWVIFNIVGVAGVAVQLGALWVLTAVAGISYVLATAIAVEVAILHNFFWHGSWTWSDRPATARVALRRLAQFNLTNGLVSLVGNVAVTAALVRFGGVHYLVANVIAIAACSTGNFLLSHRIVFAPTLCLGGLLLGGVAEARAAELSPATAAAFDRYVRLTEGRLEDERAGKLPFLWLDRLPAAQQREARARMLRGEVVVRRLTEGDEANQFPGALRHHWIATTVLRGVTLDRVVDLMQGYDRYQTVYQPAVRRSRLVVRDGDRFTVSLQLYMKKMISVVLNTDSTVMYLPVSRTQVQVRSRSTRIAEVEDPGEPGEREAPVGNDRGFLWRFNNYCAIDERQDGTYVQCESLSLSRNTPFGLGWLIGPFVTSIPRESLTFTMEAMRRALTESGDRVIG